MKANEIVSNFQGKKMRSMKFPRQSNEIPNEISRGKQWNLLSDSQGKTMRSSMKFPGESNEIAYQISKGK